MKRRLITVLLSSLALTFVCFAQDDTQLQKLLKQHPDADTNGDGVLSREEAAAYAKARRRQRSGNADNPQASESKKPQPTYRNVSYGPHERNVFDFWKAKSDKPTPLVVFIHGGGFVNGSKDGADPGTITACLDAGVSFMAINYRFRSSAPIQDILRDCARSIQFVRAHAEEYNIDRVRVASYGGSAGAGTSLWLAFHPDLADPKNSDPVLRESSRLMAAGAMNTQASYDVTLWESFLGKPDPTWMPSTERTQFYHFKDEAELKSPAGQTILADVNMLGLISADDPPVFLYNSFADGPATDRQHYVHHPDHSRAIARRCAEIGVPVTVFFKVAEPRSEGDQREALQKFLISQVKGPLPPARSLAALRATDVEYGTAEGGSLKLDLSIPEGSGPFPAAILVHGGGWQGGDKQRQVAPLFQPLNERGLAWFSINYRLAPEHKYPGSVDDVESAIRWVKAHAADYRIDPRRLVLVGESAGGHLVALVATRQSSGCEVAAVVPFYAPVNLLFDPNAIGKSAPLNAYFGITEDNAAARAILREASPFFHVKAGLPPFLLVHGTADKLVAYDQSVKFEEALRAAGVPCDLITVGDGGHGMGTWDRRNLAYKDDLLAWLDRHLNKEGL